QQILQPTQVAFEGEPSLRQRPPERAQRRAQPAHADAHAMYALGVVLVANAGLMRRDLLHAGADDERARAAPSHALPQSRLPTAGRARVARHRTPHTATTTTISASAPKKIARDHQWRNTTKPWRAFSAE